MQVSPDMTRYGIPNASRSSARVAPSRGSDLGGRGSGRDKRKLPRDPERIVNERELPRSLPGQIFTSHALTSTLAILDITALLDAGTARIVSSGRPTALDEPGEPAVATMSLDALLAGMAEPR